MKTLTRLLLVFLCVLTGAFSFATDPLAKAIDALPNVQREIWIDSSDPYSVFFDGAMALAANTEYERSMSTYRAKYAKALASYQAAYRAKRVLISLGCAVPPTPDYPANSTVATAVFVTVADAGSGDWGATINTAEAVATAVRGGKLVIPQATVHDAPRTISTNVIIQPTTGDSYCSVGIQCEGGGIGQFNWTGTGVCFKFIGDKNASIENLTVTLTANNQVGFQVTGSATSSRTSSTGLRFLNCSTQVTSATPTDTVGFKIGDSARSGDDISNIVLDTCTTSAPLASVSSAASKNHIGVKFEGGNTLANSLRDCAFFMMDAAVQTKDGTASGGSGTQIIGGHATTCAIFYYGDAGFSSNIIGVRIELSGAIACYGNAQSSSATSTLGVNTIRDCDVSGCDASSNNTYGYVADGVMIGAHFAGSLTIDGVKNLGAANTYTASRWIDVRTATSPGPTIKVDRSFASLSALTGPFTTGASPVSTLNSQASRRSLCKLAAIGDSITTQGLVNTGLSLFSTGVLGNVTGQNYTVWACLYSSGRFVYVGSEGTSGGTSADILATHVPHVVAAAIKPDICLVEMGQNDPDLLTLAQSYANYMAAGRTLRDAGIVPIFLSLLPNSNTTGSGLGAGGYKYARLNLAMQKACMDGGFEYIDLQVTPLMSLSAVSGTGGTWASGMNADNVHPSQLGAKNMGSIIATALTGLGYGAHAFSLNSANTDMSNINMIGSNGLLDGSSNQPTGWDAPSGTGVTKALASGSAGEQGNVWTLTRGSGNVGFQTTDSQVFTTAGRTYLMSFKLGSVVKATSSTFGFYNVFDFSANKLFGLQDWAEDIPAGSLLVAMGKAPASTNGNAILGTLNGSAGATCSVSQLFIADLTLLGIEQGPDSVWLGIGICMVLGKVRKARLRREIRNNWAYSI